MTGGSPPRTGLCYREDRHNAKGRQSGLKADERDSGSAMLRALDLLAAIAGADQPITVPELCQELGLPKPTVHRLCQRLETEGYLSREPGGRHFIVGPRLLRLGLDAVRTSVTTERHAILQQLVDACEETCNLVTRAGLEAVYIDRVEARWPLRLHLEIGSRVPLHCTASGKLLLAHMAPAQRKRTLDALALSNYTTHTISDRARLDADLAAISRRGYSLDDQEFIEGLVAVAVPVRDSANTVVAALACHGPLPRFGVDKATGFLPRLMEAAERLRTTLQ